MSFETSVQCPGFFGTRTWALFRTPSRVQWWVHGAPDVLLAFWGDCTRLHLLSLSLSLSPLTPIFFFCFASHISAPWHRLLRAKPQINQTSAILPRIDPGIRDQVQQAHCTSGGDFVGCIVVAVASVSWHILSKVERFFKANNFEVNHHHSSSSRSFDGRQKYVKDFEAAGPFCKSVLPAI